MRRGHVICIAAFAVPHEAGYTLTAVSLFNQRTAGTVADRDGTTLGLRRPAGVDRLDISNPWISGVQLGVVWMRYLPYVLHVLVWLAPLGGLARTRNVLGMTRDAEWLQTQIRDVPDFPSPGIVFKDIMPLPNEREMDVLLATGEQQTIALTAIALHALNVPAVSLTGAQAGIVIVDRRGRIGFAHNAEAMQVATFESGAGLRHHYAEPVRAARSSRTSSARRRYSPA